jgi:hypothetical protein
MRVAPMLLGPLLCIALCLPLPLLANDGRSLMFDLYRKDKKVGTHSIRFTQKQDILVVDIAITIKGKILFIPFTYVHENHEQWRGNVLQTLSSKTWLNDKPSELTVRAQSGGYDVQYNDTLSRIEGAIKTTSYWHPYTASEARLLNSQTGKVIPISIGAAVPVQAPLAAGGSVAARETRMTDKKKFDVKVAYDAQSCLVGLNFKPPLDNSLIVYRLVAQPNAKTAPDLLANPLMAKCLG